MSRLFKIFFILVFGLSGIILSEPVSIEQAGSAAMQFYKKNIAVTPFQSRESKKSLELQKIFAIDDVGYIADFADGGFAILSNDTDIEPVIAYIRQTQPVDFSFSDVYRFLQYDLEERLQNRSLLAPVIISQNHKLWDKLLAPGVVNDSAVLQWPEAGTTVTGGWVSTTWQQGAPYNRFCPLDPITLQRTPVGCVGVVLAQLLNYHQNIGEVSLGRDDRYVTDTRGVAIDQDSLELDFPSFQTLNGYLDLIRQAWSADSMLDNEEIAALNAVSAELLYMDFATGNSGTFSGILPRILKQRFGYESAEYMDPGEKLYQHLKENMMNALPAHLSINQSIPVAGHSILVDGFNSNGFFHVNFGWGASQPEAIADMWYHIPEYMGAGYDVVQTGTVDIRVGDEWVSPVVLSDSVAIIGPARVNETSESFEISLFNDSEQMLYVGQIVPSPNFSAAFDSAFIKPILGKVLMPKTRFSVWIRCTPDSVGRFDGSLMIEYSNQHRWQQVSLVGYGVPGQGTVVNSGQIRGTWTQNGSPYYIFQSVAVETNTVLTIEPGVDVVFMEPLYFEVGENAQLLVNGSENDSVRFRADNSDNGWYGITFNDSGDDDSLHYCIIKDGRSKVEWMGKGGALNINGSHPFISHSRIASNVAIYGGAVAFNASHATIENSIIEHNSGDIGTLYVSGQESAPILRNCLIINNNAYYGAIADLQAGASLNLVNCTIYGNSCSVRGLLSLSGENAVIIRNSIINNNSVDTGVGLWMNNDNDVQLRYTCLDTLVNDWSLDDSRVESMSLMFDDPGFVDAVENDFRLEENSAGIDAGDPNDDVGDEPFPHGFRINMGAFGGTRLAATSTGLELALVPDPLDMGLVDPFEFIQAWLYLKNGSNQTIEIGSIHLADSTYFTILSDLSANTLVSGAIDSLLIGFETNSTYNQMYMDTLFVQMNNGLCKSVPLLASVQKGTVVDTAWVWGNWTAAGQPYRIYSDIEIPAMHTLEIEAGVRVEFTGDYTFTIGKNARLISKGTAIDSVHFCAIDSNTTWGGLSFIESGGDDALIYCAVRDVNGESDTERARAGALYLDKSFPLISNCIFYNNTGQFGGAVYCVKSMPEIQSSQFISNTARYGGAFYLDASSPQMHQVLIARNFGRYDGGAVSMHNGSAPILVNVTLTHNSTIGSGGNVYLDSNTRLSLMNCIAGSSEGRYGHNFFMDRGTVANEIEFNYSCIDTTEDWIFFEDPPDNHLLWNLGNIADDPDYADSLDYHLSLFSPCIDAGNPSPVYYDVPDPVYDNTTFLPGLGGLVNDMGATGGGGCIEFQYNFDIPEWQLISLPLYCESYDIEALFPKVNDWLTLDTENLLFIKNDKTDSVSGFWVKPEQAGTLVVPGVPIHALTVQCETGWNLLGSVSEPVPLSQIQVEPAGAVADIWAWDPVRFAYTFTDVIEPGKAYWFAVQENCEITISTQSSLGDKERFRPSVLRKSFAQTWGETPPLPGIVDTQSAQLPESFELLQNFPNPFNPQTQIEYSIAKNTHVNLDVYNVLGQHVISLIDREQSAGHYAVQWDGTDVLGHSVGNGVYFYRLTTNSFESVKKMVLAR